MNTTPSQFSIFKDCIAHRLLTRPGHGQEDHFTPTELDEDFASYLAQESWPVLPPALRTATYETRSAIPDDPTISRALDTTSSAFVDTLISYGYASDTEESLQFLFKAIEAYISDACAPPPIWSTTRETECEICEREVPLTYHHLIPRSTHAKVLKKKWHPESMINSVAWLCRPCHSAVHHVATNEDLALNYHTVELLLGREDIQRWRRYAAKQRYRVKRG
ncbi:hypothetical protein BD779DRAFT_694907 [Infundibulicybe gibba]|nr:hypothetical protein BD779DRAFT_694907 [Infundibulicybe gibba]